MTATRENDAWVDCFAASLRRRFPDRSTAKHYTYDLRAFLRQQPKPLEQVREPDIDAFVDDQRANGLSPATIKRRVAALKAFFDFLAHSPGQPDRANPVCVRRHAGQQQRLLPRDLSDQEVARFLAVVHQPRDQAIVRLMLFAGLRVGEVACLTPAAICEPADPSAPIRIRVLGKGRKERMVYLIREQYQPLAFYLQTSPPGDPNSPLFRTRVGQPITVAGIQKRLALYRQRSGVAVTAHRLRHTYGRWMAEAQMPVLALARLLGHSSLQSTQRYIDGADLQLRAQYQQAMANHALPADDPAPQPADDRADDQPSAATIVPPEPQPYDGHSGLPDGPQWLRQGCLAWVEHRWNQWKPSQRSRNALRRLRQLRTFWRWQLARRQMTGFADLTGADVDAFMQAELSRGLQPRSVKSTIDGVYQQLAYLVRMGQLASTPPRPPLRLPDPLPRHLEPSQLATLVAEVAKREAAASDRDRLDLALFYLLAHAGLRISEALELRFADLDLQARRVTVRDGKGRRDRVVYFTSTASDGLSRYRDTVPHTPSDLVLSRHGRPLHYEEAWSCIAHLGQAAGIAGLAPHRLRHTYATHLLNNGMTLEALRRLMGHENMNTTLVYARLSAVTLERQYHAAMDDTAPGRADST